MSKKVEIDLVAPPFAGHLFPVLDLAVALRREGVGNPRVLSTRDAAEAIRLCDLNAVELLPGREDRVRAIADTSERVGFHPMRLYRQLRMNLALMGDLRDQLRRLWQEHRPDLVIADLGVPIAGLLAQNLGIPWWTSMPSPCAIETMRGTPAYLGGWSPREDLVGRVRDAVGRRLIRGFKRGVAALVAQDLEALDFSGIYRADGSEAIYSPERILGLGMREFEFDRDWPRAFEFIGPLTGGPPFPHSPPTFTPGRPCILVTLGTHLPWAREHAVNLIEQMAGEMADCDFHFSRGQPGSLAREERGNLHDYGFIPYDPYLPRYAAAVMHGGTGITYGCIRAAVPMLVWPHDYDQYDHAARILARGLGLRLRPSPARAVPALRRLLEDEAMRSRLREFQELSRSYDAGSRVATLVQERIRLA
jgi:UDP:flavonoid glycosyltransferase YjiC (YdhE family)